MERGHRSRQQQLQQLQQQVAAQSPVVLATAVIMGTAVVLMYILVSRHLSSIDDITLALTESIAEQASNQKNDLRSLVAALENHTFSVASSVQGHVALQTLQLQHLAADLRNHSRFVRGRMGDLPSVQVQEMKELVEELRGRAKIQPTTFSSSFEGGATSLSSAGGGGGGGPNTTAMMVASLRSQKRIETALSELMGSVQQLLEKGGGGGGGGGLEDVPTLSISDVLTVARKQLQFTKSLQDSIDSLSDKIEAEIIDKAKEASPTEEKILAALKALVGHLRAKEREEGGEASTHSLLSSLIAEVRNKTTFVNLLRAVRTQTAIVGKLGTRITSLEAKVLQVSLGGGSSAGDASGRRADASAAVAATVVTETQNSLAIVLREVQKQSEEIADLHNAVDLMKPASETAAAAGFGSNDVVFAILEAVRNQTAAIERVEEKIARLERIGLAGASSLEKLDVAVKDEEAGEAGGGEEVGKGESEVLKAVEEVIKSEERGPDEVSEEKLRDGASWQQHTFAGTPGFSRFSGYRVGPRKMVAVGVGSMAMKETRNVESCRWQSRDAAKSSNCSATLSYGLARRNAQFETVVVTATFVSDVDSSGGLLLVTIDRVEYALYREEEGEFAKLQPSPPFPTKAAACLSPNVPAHVDARIIREFVEYHLLVGFGHFVLYDAGLWKADEVKGHFGKEKETGVVEVTMFRAVKAFELEGSGHLLSLYDCVFRLAYTAEWVLSTELNEYFYVKPPQTLPQLLDANRDAPWLSVGSQWWSSKKCSQDFAADGDKFTIELMVFRWPIVLCHDLQAHPDRAKCLGDIGYRKMIVNPRKVDALGLHYAHALEGKGVDLNAEVAIENHFQDFMKDPSKWCSEVHEDKEVVEWWTRDFHLRNYAQDLRAGKKCDWKKGECKDL